MFCTTAHRRPGRSRERRGDDRAEGPRRLRHQGRRPLRVKVRNGRTTRDAQPHRKGKRQNLGCVNSHFLIHFIKSYSRHVILTTMQPPLFVGSDIEMFCLACPLVSDADASYLEGIKLQFLSFKAEEVPFINSSQSCINRWLSCACTCFLLVMLWAVLIS